jgi:eukaryotic-like serine/threonine-protein kinase
LFAVTETSLRDRLQRTLGEAYRLERELGGGGMSRVFVAEELRLGRKVVVKVLSPDLSQGLSAERFEREIRTVAGLQQANIVPVLAAGETDGLPFYTMPFVEGESLRHRLARGPLPVADVVAILRDVTRALSYAHARGVVHRDIKPDNVLLSGDTAVVTDFGIAKAISAARTGGSGATLTQIGTSIGTPAYMAPEQAAGDADVDHRADIYSLGAMTYELLAGEPVFASRTPQRMLAAHLSESPRPIGELRPDTPPALASMVMRCLAKDPSLRPQASSEVTRELDAMASGSGSTAMPPVLLGGPGMFRKALAFYAVAFLIVVVVAKAAIVGIGLPDWVFPGALIVMALGLPAILWTGYVQRVTRRAITATPTYTPGGGVATTHGRLATVALKAAPHVSWYRAARGGMYALGAFVAVVAAFMGLRALGVGPFASLLASGRLDRHDPIIIDDFRTTNVDSSLGRVVSDLVRTGLSGSSALTLLTPQATVSALERMKLAPTTRVDSAVARQIALREGLKAIVDGEVTGVAGGYIVSIRLVRADSGTELTAFRKGGDGPKGLIDAADKLARSLRAKIGESLRAVNESPPLGQVTTGSLDALRKYSEGGRANVIGDVHAIELARQAVALDSTFAAGWRLLANALANYGGTRSAMDSAYAQAYRYRERLPLRERDMVDGDYFSLGPGRDRTRAASAYGAIIERGDSLPGALIALGELLRSRREFARAESLNLAVSKTGQPSLELSNAAELELDQGKFAEVAATLARLRPIAPTASIDRELALDWAKGDDKLLRTATDSLLRLGANAPRQSGLLWARSLALRDGRLHDYWSLGNGALPPPRQPGSDFPGATTFVRSAPFPDDSIFEIMLDVAIAGPSPAIVAQLDSAIARVPFRELPMIDRPYLSSAIALARVGSVDKARAMIARYHAEVTDTSITRVREADLHTALGEIALAAGKPRDALVEFRRGDIGFDGAPATECAPCLPFNLARAYDAAGKADSAAMMFEQYLSTPYWFKPIPELDPVRVPAIRERLGQLYESMGNTEKAIENYRAFIDMWKNADPELQPRVADARKRLARLTPVEKARP